MDNQVLNNEYLRCLSALIYGMCREFYWSKKLQGRTYLDEEILSGCIVDIFYDLQRLSEFHEIERPSMSKVVAYSASWIIRRKPFQMVQGYNTDDHRYKYINEKLALFMLIRRADTDWKYPVDTQKKESMQATLHRLLYHLIYRNTNAQTLELLLNGIEFGILSE